MGKFLKLTEALIIAIIEKLGGEDAALSFLYSEPENNSWVEKDGIIYFSVISDGRTGPEWIDYFEENNIEVSEWAEPVLRSRRFKPTNGVLTEVAIIKKAFDEPNVSYDVHEYEEEEIKLRAKDLGFKEPNPEVICLIIEKISINDLTQMDLDWLLSMHKPIIDEDKSHDPCETLLSVAIVTENYYLDGQSDSESLRCSDGLSGGFVYAKSTVKVKKT